MELLLGLVCDDARTTSEGKLDVLGIFNDLYAPGFPAKQDRMVLVLAMEWDRDDRGRFHFRVDLKGPDGRPTLTVDGHTDVDRRPASRPPPRTRIIMPLEDVVFPAPGAYRFHVRMKGEEYPGPSLHVVRQEPAGPEHEREAAARRAEPSSRKPDVPAPPGARHPGAEEPD